ncbi:MAG TPA: (2Fe-2S)-binding protein [Polyangiaceae bacterium]|nr:(2Fe-2S)-binding protein [Polyangiaceae bacterium]
MSHRLTPIRHKAEFLHDGDLIAAELGEPLAHSLIAEGRLALARSPKLHRPRGPYCLRAACDGCLVRVDGVPNVMACRHRVQGGETVETQNVLGSRELDLLQATDFLFPHGMDHHRLFAGVRGVSAVVQRVARRIAGLGRLADEPAPVREAAHESRDVVIVGGGAAGLAAASVLGPRALLVDDALELGGSLGLLAPERAEQCLRAAREAGAELRSETSAVGVYRDTTNEPALSVLLSGPSGVSLVRVRFLLLASGGHDANPGFAGNDLPGIFSARAALSLLKGEIAPGERVAVVGQGPFAEQARLALGKRCVITLAGDRAITRVEGRQALSAIFLHEGPRRVKVDALLYDGPRAPAFELAVQAGGHTRFDPARGYLPELDAQSRAAPGVFCAGSLTGRAESSEQQGTRAARQIAQELAES